MSMITCARIVIIDSEFDAKKGRGEIPGFPHNICALEVLSDGSVIEHRLKAPYPKRPPWDRGDRFLTVGWALSAEAGSFMHAGLPFPVPAIDLYAEYLTIHNTEMSRGDGGKQPVSLLQACQRYGVPTMDKMRKNSMRELAYTVENPSPEQIAKLQDYCIDDCWHTLRLYLAMRPHIDMLRAPVRGAYMMEIERIRWRGPPIDAPLYRRTLQRVPYILPRMRAELNRKLGAEVYLRDVFKRKTMFEVMRRNNIPIPSIRKLASPAALRN